jgi:1,4-alpha-glucan branching enzyme
MRRSRGGAVEIHSRSELGDRYKFELRTRTGDVILKIDPFGFELEAPPLSASIVCRPEHEWRDAEWMNGRSAKGCWFDRPMSVYEVHLGSWARVPDEEHRYLTYAELAERLVGYVKEMGYTHIELLPVMEHPFPDPGAIKSRGSSRPPAASGRHPTSRSLRRRLSQAGIGVLLDWVPGHFPRDAHAWPGSTGPRSSSTRIPAGEHRDWGTLIFNYGRNEVRNYLLANALFWLHEYHVDGLRVDAVASMLYLDYSRNQGEWIPNKYGGRENLEAIEFVRQLNTLTHGESPGSLTIAEESTAWPSVSRPAYLGGLGFTYKWNMGWMNDILEYVKKNPVYRRYDHQHLTFSLLYAFTENFILPFSHDEVVHGKGSMFGKIAGDDWQKAATLRALYGFMFAHPGKKLMFMGAEFGQGREWNHDHSLDWHLLEEPLHAGIRRFVQDLNRTYRAEPALHEVDFDGSGFSWIDCNDNENSVVSLIRRAKDGGSPVIAVINFTPCSAMATESASASGGYSSAEQRCRGVGSASVGNAGVFTGPISARA